MFYFSKLQVDFFRGFRSLHIELSNDFIFIYGDNGSGKTNFLEILNVLCLTKSFKTISDKELVQWSQDFYFLKADIHHFLINSVACNYLKNKGKKILHDNQPIHKFSEHIGLLPCVSLIPEDSDIIKDATKRKKWFNLLFSQWDHDYLYTLQNYENALQQRNILLKSQKPFKELEPWTYQLCIHGKNLVDKRKHFFDKLLKIYTQIHFELNHWEVSNFFYQPNYEYQDIKTDMLNYENHLKSDFLSGFTTLGAHRDDVTFQINDYNLKHCGSQGQQKTFIITLKLAEYEFLSQNSKTPILLLDDVFEKLDKKRIQCIANYLFSHRKSQVFVTHPQFLSLDFQPKILQVKEHEIHVMN